MQDYMKTKFYKKILNVLLAGFMAISLYSNPHMDTLANESNEFYVENGQIDFNSLVVLINDNNLLIESKTREYNESVDLLSQLCQDNDFKEEIINLVQTNNLPEVMGFSTYELKEVVNDDGSVHLEPVTISEKLTRDVPTQTKHKLTLTLSINSSTSTSSKYINAQLNMYWAYPNGAAAEFRPERSRPDYVSMTFPAPYMIDVDSNGGISGGVNPSPTLEDITNYAAVTSFYEAVGSTYMNAESAMPIPTAKERRFIARYVHTYSNYTPSFSISDTGDVTFNGVSTSNDMWAMAVYVDYIC